MLMKYSSSTAVQTRNNTYIVKMKSVLLCSGLTIYNFMHGTQPACHVKLKRCNETQVRNWSSIYKPELIAFVRQPFIDLDFSFNSGGTFLIL